MVLPYPNTRRMSRIIFRTNRDRFRSIGGPFFGRTARPAGGEADRLRFSENIFRKQHPTEGGILPLGVEMPGCVVFFTQKGLLWLSIFSPGPPKHPVSGIPRNTRRNEPCSGIFGGALLHVSVYIHFSEREPRGSPCFEREAPAEPCFSLPEPRCVRPTAGTMIAELQARKVFPGGRFVWSRAGRLGLTSPLGGVSLPSNICEGGW
jgi:hypothetical protein